MKKENGITLVALIITVIVLLILATVSINLVINNGILDKAKTAVDKYSDEEIEEQIKLSYLEYEMARLTNTNLDATVYMKESLEKMYGKDTVDVTKEDDVFHIEITFSNGSKKYYLNNRETGIYKSLEDYGVQIGDYINYDCYTGAKSSDLYYKSLESANGNADQEFQVLETNKTMKWKVLGINSHGQLLITTADPILTKNQEEYYIKGKIGYINGIEELDNISKIYGYGKNAIGARSITLEDVNKTTGQYTNVTFYEYSYTKKEDGKVYRNDTTDAVKTEFWYYNSDPHNEWINLLVGDTSRKIKNTYYNITIGTATNKQRMIRYKDDNSTNASYWIASRVEWCRDTYVSYRLRYIKNGNVSSDNLFTSYGENGRNYSGIRPVVTLNSNIKLSGSNEQGWTIN